MNTIRPNFSGTWKADLARSKLLGVQPQEMVVEIDHAAPMIAVEMLLTLAGGATHRIVFQAEIGEDEVEGKIVEYAVGGTLWRSHLTWAGDELLIASHLNQNGRDFHFRDFWSVSKDAKTLTMIHRGDDLAGQIAIFDRVES